MLQAITPGDDIFNYRFNLQKKSDVLRGKYQKINILPVIKTFKDQMTATEDIRTCIGFNNSKIRAVNETTILMNVLNKNLSNTSASNMITNNSNKIYPKLYFNKNFKLKSIPQKLIKSNSTTNINSLSSNKTLSIISFPSKMNQPKILKNSESQPRLNINHEYFENNKCNYLILKYTGEDNSKKDIKKKKYLVLNSHKVIDSLKSISMPNDNYGKKLMDVIQERINSGFYRNYRFNFSHKYQTIQIDNNKYEKKIKPNKIKKEEEKKFDGTFLKDIYDNNLLPGIDNKYNYTVHKIFLSQILEKIFKKMVEVRDKTNKVITKEEIRKEYINEVDNLRKTLLTGQDYKIINNIYNINNNYNIISVNLSRNQKLNDMGIIVETQEGKEQLDTTIEEKDNDKQSLTSNLFNSFHDKTIKDIENRKQNMDNIESNYKLIHKENNTKILSYIKNKINIPKQNISIHDSFMNLYFNRIKSANKDNLIESNNQYSKRKYMHNLTVSESYFDQEEKLSNVEKFILNTKKLRYTFNIQEKKEKEKERNLSFDSEGNVINYFEVGMKLNPVFFDDIYDELQEQYNINNNILNKQAKNDMIKEILRYYLHKKGLNLKFNDKISKKYLSMLVPKVKKIQKKQKKKIKKKLIPIKEETHIIEEIGKKIHKKINIKRGRNIISNSDKINKNNIIRKYNSENNLWQINQVNILNDDDYTFKTNKININERQFTENNYLEIETNSSEFSDIPSELDSEIVELIKKKEEKEKNRDKDVEEGIYSRKNEAKSKGGDFIITKPEDRNKNKKEEEKKKEEIEKIEKEKEKEIEDTNNKKGNLNMFLNIDEKGDINKEEKNKKKPLQKIDKKTSVKIPQKEKEKEKVISKPQINNNVIDNNKKVKTKDKNIEIDIDNIKSTKIKSDENINNINNINNKIKELHKDKHKIDKKKKEEITKDRNTTNISTKATKIVEDKIISKKKQKKEKEKEKEKITEDVNKGTKTSNKVIEETKGTNEAKDIKKQKEIIPILIKDKNDKKEKSSTSLYQNIIINHKEKSSEKGRNPESNENSSNIDKNIIPTIGDKDKNNLNESSINPTSDHLSIMGVMNLINLKEKSANISKIDEDTKKKAVKEFENENEDNDILKVKNKKNTSFYNERKINKMRIETPKTEEKIKKQSKKRNSESLNSSHNFLRLIYFLDKYKKEKIQKEEEGEVEDEGDLYNYYDEEKTSENDEEKGKRRKKRIKKRQSSNLRQFLIDENMVKEENAKKVDKKKEVEVILPKKDEWENRFKMFKLYINKLKGMNQEEFRNDLLKFLKEEEKIDFTQKEKLNKVDRINKYKAFVIASKRNKLKYNSFHSSHILFAPGCIFNTDNLF